MLAFQHQERAFAQTSRLKDAALREARRERAEFEARRQWWEEREEELEEKLLLEEMDSEISAGVEFERGYRVGREEGVKEGREEGRREGKEEGMREGRKEGFKEAQGMFLGGLADEVEGEGSLVEEDGYAGRMEEAEAPQEEEEEDMGGGAGPTATVRPRVAARALVLDEDYDEERGSLRSPQTTRSLSFGISLES